MWGASLQSGDLFASDQKITIKTKRKKIFRKIKEYFEAIAHSARTKRRTETLRNDLRVIETRIDQVRDTLREASKGHEKLIHNLEHKIDEKIFEILDKIKKSENKIEDEKLTRQRIATDLLRAIKSIENGRENQNVDTEVLSSKKDISENKFILDSFYYLLEEKYRGTREEITDRLKIYMNEFEKAKARTLKNGTIIDLGCGRGEFLELLNSYGFNSIGVDNNPIQLRAAENKKLSVINEDVFEYITKIPDNSIMAITVIHLIEHLSFDKLITLCSHIFRILMPGGVVILETPNPKNLIVGATTFHLDPTHVKPIPSEVCSVLMEVLGYQNISINHIHPSTNYRKYLANEEFDNYLAELLFGPQDYSVIAQKGIIK